MTNPLNDNYTLPFEGNLHDGTIILLPYRIDTWEDGGNKAFNEMASNRPWGMSGQAS